MNSRNIIKTIVTDKKCPERCGIHEHFWPHLLENRWADDGYPEDTSYMEYFNLDIHQLGGWFNTQARVLEENELVEETEETRTMRNGWGTLLRFWKKKAGTPEHLGFSLTSEEVWKKEYREHFLSLNKDRFGDLKSLCEKNKTAAKEDDRFTVFGNLFIFEIMRASMGDVVMLENILLNKAWIEDFCTVLTDFYITHLEYMFSEAGVPDGFFLYEDLGYTNAPFISPDLHQEMILPHHKKLVDFIHTYDIPVIIHTCGNIEPHIPAIIEAGFDCLQPMEAKTGMNVVALGKQYAGKISFMGNIDIQALETNDRDTIREEVLSKLNGVTRNRIPYVLHSDHSISPGVSLESYKYMVELFRENCDYVH